MLEMRKLQLGGREFIIPALTLDQLQELDEDLQAMNPLTRAGIAAIRKCLISAFGGSITDADLGQLAITLEELDAAQSALAEVSGLRPLIERLAREYASRQAGPTPTPPSA